MANPTPDFVMVQLTPAGQAQAAGGPLRLSNGRRSFVFTGAEAVKVEISYEWRAVLSRAITRGGEPMFQLAADPAPQASAAGVVVPVAPAVPEAPKPAEPVK